MPVLSIMSVASTTSTLPAACFHKSAHVAFTSKKDEIGANLKALQDAFKLIVQGDAKSLTSSFVSLKGSSFSAGLKEQEIEAVVYLFKGFKTWKACSEQVAQIAGGEEIACKCGDKEAPAASGHRGGKKASTASAAAGATTVFPPRNAGGQSAVKGRGQSSASSHDNAKVAAAAPAEGASTASAADAPTAPSRRDKGPRNAAMEKGQSSTPSHDSVKDADAAAPAAEGASTASSGRHRKPFTGKPSTGKPSTGKPSTGKRDGD